MRARPPGPHCSTKKMGAQLRVGSGRAQPDTLASAAWGLRLRAKNARPVQFPADQDHHDLVPPTSTRLKSFLVFSALVPRDADGYVLMLLWSRIDIEYIANGTDRFDMASRLVGVDSMYASMWINRSCPKRNCK
jgi:hypothetical protein